MDSEQIWVVGGLIIELSAPPKGGYRAHFHLKTATYEKVVIRVISDRTRLSAGVSTYLDLYALL